MGEICDLRLNIKMASTSDDENIVPEETVRRTRSGRAVKTPAISPMRTTRRSKKVQENVSEISIIEEHQANTVDDEPSANDNIQIPHEDDKSSSYLFGEIQSDIGCIYEQSSADKEELTSTVPHSTESVDNLFFADLAAEENANSLPSGGAIEEETNDAMAIDDEDNDTAALVNTTTEQIIDSDAEIVEHECEIVEETADDNGIEEEMAENRREMEQQRANREANGEAVMIARAADVEPIEESQTSISDYATMEDLMNGNESEQTKDDFDAELVSEDELPIPEKTKVEDAEEVSDDELPGPKLAELPADTEVVSEDELPARKRKADEGYDPVSPTDSGGATEKKTKIDDGIDEEKEEEKKPKKLPDLDKYWKAVNDDAADFTAWTYLLQYVDQENDIEAAREAYDAFLAHYPYCYGYWRKYADYEKRKGNKKKCEEVFERGLKAIPLSVDLWIHYLAHVKANYADDEQYVRSQFERALFACGLEFRSDKLWEAFIKWETEAKRFGQVVQIYDRLLATPTQGYNGHFDSFQEIVNSNAPHILITADEYKRLRAEVREDAKPKTQPQTDEKVEKTEEAADDKPQSPSSAAITTDDTSDEKNAVIVPEAEAETEADGPKVPVDETIVAAKESESANKSDDMEIEEEAAEEPKLETHSEEEDSAIREKIISLRRKLHKNTITAVTARWTFEEGIKRPYFHVKPLERCQLKNWKEYLEFEIDAGDQMRVLVLFERCLIACALYDEFWLKLVRYLETQTDAEMVLKTRDAYERACTVHHPDKPSLHLMWSAFEECHNNCGRAAEILTNLEKVCPNLLQVAYRRINLERRRGDLVKCVQMYEHYIGVAKNKNVASSLGIKYARFCHKIKNDLDGGLVVLRGALEKDPSNTRIALQMIDLVLQRAEINETEVVTIMDSFMARDGMEAEQKVLFAQRKVEFLEDFGCSAKGLQDAQRTLQLALSKATEAKKKTSETTPSKKSSKEGSSTTTPAATSASTAATSYNNSYNYASTPASSYYGTGAQAANSGSQAAAVAAAAAAGYPSYGDPSYNYNQWSQYTQSGYSGYGQWGNYGNYY